MFIVFGKLLESINNKASPEEVLKWKRSEKTKACYKQLFEDVENSDETYMSRILKKIWLSGDATSEKVAYAIAVCQAMLDKNYEKITMSDTAIKNRAARNLVNIYNYFYYYFFKIIFNILALLRK